MLHGITDTSSSGSNCQLTLTDDSSVSNIHFPEGRNLDDIEYLPIYPKRLPE